MPSRVLMRMRSASNSATIASTLNRRRPTGSVGSWTDPPRLSLTSRAVSSSAMSRASGRERASLSELGHDEGVALAAGRERFAKPRPRASRAGQAVVNVDALRLDAEPCESVTLGSEVLLVGGYAR